MKQRGLTTKQRIQGKKKSRITPQRVELKPVLFEGWLTNDIIVRGVDTGF
jgi:hypothetical protein